MKGYFCIAITWIALTYYLEDHHVAALELTLTMTNYCPHCGSLKLRADRSLGGRIICSCCGRPVNQGRRTLLRPRSQYPRSLLIIFLIFTLVIFVLVLSLG